VLVQGAGWAVAHGFGTPADLEHIEGAGALPGAEPDQVSVRALERGRDQLGTVGSGNHFIEVGTVDEVYDPLVAERLRLQRGTVTVMIHSGSRGLGYQVCADSLDTMLNASTKYGIELPDRQLACAPLDSPEAKSYLGAMCAAANDAFGNRQMMAHRVREAFGHVFGTPWTELGMDLDYDVAHNIAKWEEHEVEGRVRRLCVQRKGATRAFPPGHAELSPAYRELGQPVLIPGDMARYSFVLIGTETGFRETFGLSCHGAGRTMSRNQAKKLARGRNLEEEFRAKGIEVRAASYATVAEEVRSLRGRGQRRGGCGPCRDRTQGRAPRAARRAEALNRFSTIGAMRHDGGSGRRCDRRPRAPTWSCRIDGGVEQVAECIVEWEQAPLGVAESESYRSDPEARCPLRR
jgi:tRNA-splicing ligase RtcB (3'-phosphate/5'-hydroxy nucleic acid ligase)